MSKGEILAPAGSFESLTAAVRSGADAVYLGASSFNARQNAENFDFEKLREAVKYCHSHGTAVHLTLNTLISDKEMKDAVDTAVKSAECGVDAIIIQDFGLVSNVQKVLPDMPLHGSTQMSIQTEYGIDFLSSLGFTRAVLPRELSEKEILNLLEKSDIELEMFVHGALCMCVSGQCYMSAMIGRRSGNRGLCAQPCRLPFKAKGGNGYDLSLKDNSLIPYIKRLSDAGIASFKIEGRMKRPEYVAAAVTSCKNALDNIVDDELDRDLKSVFSRSGFTDGYFKGKIGKEMFGTRSKNDVEASASVLNKLQKLYEKENPKFPISFNIKIRKDEPICLSAKCNGIDFDVFGDVPQIANSRGADFDSVKKQIEKCGGTQFFMDKFECEIDENLFVPASVLNNLRREALEKISNEMSQIKEYIVNEFEAKKNTPHISNNTKVYAVFSSVDQIPDNTDDAEIFLPITENADDLKKLSADKNVGIILPRGLTSNIKAVENKLKELSQAGIKKAICPTVDSFILAKKYGFETVMGLGSNIYNTDCLNFFEKHGADEALVSIELTHKSISELGGTIPRGAILYGKIPLMLTKNCPVRNGTDCKNCKMQSKIKDRKGVEFEVTCSMGYSEILNSYPLYLFDKKSDFNNLDFHMLLFTTEDREQCKEIFKKYNLSSPAEGEFTRGLYYRGSE